MAFDPKVPGSTSQADNSTAGSTPAPVVVSGSQFKWRREFNDATLAMWNVVTGSGMAVSAGSSALVITTGTTASTTTTVTSKQAFTAPFKVAFGVLLSQKIVNQEFYVEIVAESTSDQNVIDETVVASWRIAGNDSVTNTVGRIEVQNGGPSKSQSANLTALTAQTGTAAVYEITLEADEVWFHNKGIDNTGPRTTPYVRNSVSPDPTRRFRVRYRVINGATPPASTTTFTSPFVSVVDFTEQQVEVTGGNGSIGGAQAIPMYITGGVNLTTNGSYINPNVGATGTTVAKIQSAATTNATSVKATAARLYGMQLSNTTASFKYFRVYSKASAPTVGTDSPLFIIPIPPNFTVESQMTYPITITAGLAYSITGANGDLDATAVAAGDVVGALYYI